ncbi:MAG: hypothetical protein RLZZ490_2003 [Cyanobacteriota bacterium]
MTAQTLKSRPARRSRQRNRPRPSQTFQPEHQWLLAEIFFKLGLNAVLALVSGIAVFRLIPYQQLQQQKLDEITMQVEETEQRVKQLRKDFNRSFDPSQSRKIMEELSPRHNPNQRRIILTPPQN